MLDTVTITKTIAAPSHRVWAALSGIGGLDRWFPIIRQCRIEGEGIGALRIMELANGAEMVDRIDDIDPEQQCLCYTRIVLPFPASDYHGKVCVQAADKSQSVVAWTVWFSVAEADRLEMNTLVASAISNGLCGLDQELSIE